LHPRPDLGPFLWLALASAIEEQTLLSGHPRTTANMDASLDNAKDSPNDAPPITADMGTSSNSPTGSRDNVPPITSTPQTRYMIMLVQANQVQKRYEFGAAFSAWISLAGYVVLPNTFTSLKNASSLNKTASGKIVQEAVQHVELLKIAFAMCCIGTTGNCVLWYAARTNYVWLNSRIFLQVS
jgi:hypothetical protein